MSLYHGTQYEFEVAEPRRSRRWTGYDQEGVHATAVQGIALTYCFHAVIPGYKTGVSLYKDTRKMLLVGPTTVEDAIQACTRFPCFLHEFDAEPFKTYVGLGPLELVSVTAVRPIATTRFDSWEELKAAFDAAGMTITFRQE